MSIAPLVFYIVALLSAYFTQSLYPSLSLAILANLTLLGIGIHSVWAWFNFSFQAENTAHRMGYAPSPFQYQISYIYFAFAVTGVMAYYFPIMIPGLVMAYSFFAFASTYGLIKNIATNDKATLKPMISKLIVDILTPLTLLACMMLPLGF